MFSKNQIIAISGIVVLCLTFLVSIFIIANGNLYIKNLGSATLQNDKVLNTLSVDGQGRAYGRPDMMQISISVSEVAATSDEALRKANEKINEVSGILKQNGIESKDIQTSQFSIYPEYEYLRDSTRLIGQRATIGLTATLKNLDTEAKMATGIIDAISQVNNIQIGGISFDIEDKNALLSQARAEAFQKAKVRAEELASLGSLRLLSPVSISESTIDYSPYPARNIALDAAETSAGSTATQLQTGELEVSVSVSIIFGIE
jgi:uncharacterized protein YggE